MNIFRFSAPPWTLALLVALLSLCFAASSADAQRLREQPVFTSSSRAGLPSALPVSDAFTAAPPSWTSKLDASARMLALGTPASARGSIATLRTADGRETVDLFVQTISAPNSLRSLPGVEVRAVVDNIAVIRAPFDALESLARNPEVRFIEVSQIRQPLNDTGRADLRADIVQNGGGGLPRAFRGEGVVVGVLDSGLDVTHPDFFNAGGSRVQFLLEFLQNGGQATYTKAQIDANPAAIPERDGNGGGGHGTHVTGTAAGSGNLNAALRGIAPASDLIFVKGVRHPDSQGGFSDADVVAGTDFVFQRAATLGRPAVLNLSLGGQFGSHDGTSLYEQSLTGLTGPGKIIVAAAGNEGNSIIHAGANVQTGQNLTLLLPNGPDFAGATLWYDAGSLNQFAIAAYVVNGGQLDYLDLMSVNAGQVLSNGGQPVPFVVQGIQIGSIIIDAAATQDPRNGDGNVLFQIQGGNGIDISNIVWGIVSAGTSPGRLDAWALQSEFYAGTIGFTGLLEIPGNKQMTVGVPSTALGLLAVGSHVTNNDWVDIDGIPRNWLNPNPDGNPNSPPVVPTVGQRSYFSSMGPTRDGRISPDVTGPGEYIFSPLSSHVTIGGAALQRQDVLSGGGYRGFQGTSMASPHLTGTVALMLQANPALTPTDVRQILQTTARTDGFTGAVPNNRFGSGKADALAAVLRVIQLCGASCSGGSGTTITETEPNNTAAQAQLLAGNPPITLNGTTSNTDVGGIIVTYGDGSRDDIEDLFRVVTSSPGFAATLSGYSQDLDIFVISEATGQIVASSTTINPTEVINDPALPAGSYLVGVSFYDASGETGNTPYSLVVTATMAVDEEATPELAGLTLAPAYPNPARHAAEIEFDLPTSLDTRLAVFDVLGREVARLTDGPLSPGTHRLSLDAASLGTGVYVVRLTAGGELRTRTLVVAR